MKGYLSDLIGNGRLMAFSGVDGDTSCNNGMVLRHIDGKLLVMRPLSGAEIIPGGNITLLGGDYLIAGQCRAAIADAFHILFSGKVSLSGDTKGLKCLSRGDKTLIGTAEAFREELLDLDVDTLISQRQHWCGHLELPAGIPTDTRRCLALALSQLKTQIYSPEGRIKHYWTTPDRWPHRNMWLWDSVFHAAGLRHASPELARDAVSAMFDAQNPDGFIPHTANPDTSSSITQPPILALGVSLIDELSPDTPWLQECYPKLKAYLEWDMANRDSDGGGLLEWFIENDVNCRSGESGMDNSPRFDSATRLDATDFNSFLALECELMSGFAERLGLENDARAWKEKHLKLCGLINARLWNSESGFYFDYDLDHDRLSPVMASSGFLPLICGAPSMEQAAMLAAHLEDPRAFGSPFPVPSISGTCREFYSKDMWRGPVWTNINWLIIRGLKRYGFTRLADKLRDQTIAVQQTMTLRYGTFFEYYDDAMELDPPKLLRKGCNNPAKSPFHQAFHDYGWSATLFIDMVMEKQRGR